MAGQNVQLDHVLVLLPYNDLISPPDWITQNFTVSPGGVHADGRTENRLIFLRDGTYIELISFVNDDPEKRKGQWSDGSGLVAYAIMSPQTYDFDALQKRLKDGDSGIEFTARQPGGRTRPDGVELKWETMFPTGNLKGPVPFWCHDVTPRERRVLITEANTKHPSGAVGMSGLVLKVKEESTKQLESAISAVLNHSGQATSTLSSPDGSQQSTIRVEQDSALGTGYNISLTLKTTAAKVPDVQEMIGNSQLVIRFDSSAS